VDQPKAKFNNNLTYSFGLVANSTLIFVFVIILNLNLRLKFVFVYLKAFLTFISVANQIFKWIVFSWFHLLVLAAKQFFKLVVALGNITKAQS